MLLAYPFLFDVLADDLHLELRAGDTLAVDLRRARMWTASRILQPNYGYLAGLLADGVIVWRTPLEVHRGDRQVPPFPLQVVA